MPVSLIPHWLKSAYCEIRLAACCRNTIAPSSAASAIDNPARQRCQHATQFADWPRPRETTVTPNDQDPKKLNDPAARPEQDVQLRQVRALADMQRRFPSDQFPKSNYLAAAIKDLLPAGPNTPPQTVVVDAGTTGCYRVTFVARQNAGHGTPAWFWGVESGERIPERRGKRRG